MCQVYSHLSGFLHNFVLAKLATSSIRVKSSKSETQVSERLSGSGHKSKFRRDIDHSNAEATFIQSTRTQRFLKTIKVMSCWYSLDSSR